LFGHVFVGSLVEFKRGWKILKTGALRGETMRGKQSQNQNHKKGCANFITKEVAKVVITI